jgi:hypothetical protein
MNYFYLPINSNGTFYFNATAQQTLPSKAVPVDFTIRVLDSLFVELEDGETVVHSSNNSITLSYFYFDLTSLESLSIVFRVLSGSPITVNVGVSPSGENFYFHCGLDNDCMLPFTSKTSPPILGRYFLTIYAENTNFSITLNQGTQNCEEIELPSGSFCDLPYKSWNYGNNTEKDLFARRYFEQLYSTIHCLGSCMCNEGSQACNESLRHYACSRTFPACDKDGFETEICQDLCGIITDKCDLQGVSLQDIPELDCSHNSYIDGSKDICTGCSWYSCGECNGTGESCGIGGVVRIKIFFFFNFSKNIKFHHSDPWLF